MPIKNQFRIISIAALLATLILVLFFNVDLSAQCQMCRTALTSSPEGERWSRGIDAGIMLLLAAPFLIGGSMALVIYRPRLPSLARLRDRFGRVAFRGSGS